MSWLSDTRRKGQTVGVDLDRRRVELSLCDEASKEASEIRVTLTPHQAAEIGLQLLNNARDVRIYRKQDARIRGEEKKRGRKS